MTHITRRSEEETTTTVMEWKTAGERPRGGLRKRW